jgi:hypothetical protein
MKIKLIKDGMGRRELELLETAACVKNGKEAFSTLDHMVRTSQIYASLAIKYPEILKIADENGSTIAHTMTYVSPTSAIELMESHPELLPLADKNGRTVAHAIAIMPIHAMKLINAHPELLPLADKNGVTVAHAAAAASGKTQMTITQLHPELLPLADIKGITVAHIVVAYSREATMEIIKNHPELLMCKRNGFYTVAYDACKFEEAVLAMLECRRFDVFKGTHGKALIETAMSYHPKLKENVMLQNILAELYKEEMLDILRKQ